MASIIKRQKYVLDTDDKPEVDEEGKRITEDWADKKGRPRWDATISTGQKATPFKYRTFLRKKDADAWARQEEGDKDRNELRVDNKETLSEYLQGPRANPRDVSWLASHAGQVRAVTIYNYRMVLRRWILDEPKPEIHDVPRIGHIRLVNLRAADLNGLYNYMLAKGLKPRGIRTLHDVIRPALEDAVREGILTKNAAKSAKVPKENASGEEKREDAAKIRALTKEQAGRFLVAAKEHVTDPIVERVLRRYEALWILLLTGGLRPCEAFGLKWRDVDWEEGCVRVEHSLTRHGVDRTKHPDGWKLTLPKSENSSRDVTLPPLTMKVLKRWRTLQAWEKRTIPEYVDHGFVFAAENGSPIDGSNLYRKPFRRLCERAGIGEYIGPEPCKPRSGPTARREFKPGMRIYDLRHTHATHLLMDGEDLLVVSRRLGHASIKLTADTYASVLKERERGSADRLERMYGSSAG